MKTSVKCIVILCLSATIASCKATRKATSANKNTSSTNPAEKSRITNVEKKSPDKINELVQTARSYIGTPYKYGGNSKSGIDCSGLACQVYKSIGIDLPRTASDQCNAGKKIEINDIRPGDLLFFTDRKGNNKITHVGIVSEVSGKNSIKFIHASTKRGVTESELLSDYYKPLFLKAVRIF
ncbi:MAG: C40 family peptidase [Cytophagaceae bacterium]|nr:C40 family peptidase [Cytophagaceae bacterium]MDW8456041.1 C40 family peptidase [Cytophagaceae bacterium]